MTATVTVTNALVEASVTMTATVTVTNALVEASVIMTATVTVTATVIAIACCNHQCTLRASVHTAKVT